MKKGSKLYSVTHFTCPQCNEGKFFVSHPYDLKYVGDVKDNCDVCGLKYSREPGFFYGAMYVAYALGVALFVTIWASCNWFFDNVGVWTQIGLVVFFSIVLSPFLFALSKIIWANFFIHYQADAKFRKQEKLAH
jgi:uncharacterized protein (DUF983 family)